MPGKRTHQMLELEVVNIGEEMHRVRVALEEALSARRVDHDHVAKLAVVATELLGAAFESGVEAPVTLTVDEFRLLTSVRVHCRADVDLRDDPFELRERVLGGLALAYGTRASVDGGVDLWAEVARERADADARS